MLIIYSLFLAFFNISFRTTLAIVGGYIIGQTIFATISLVSDIQKVTRGLLKLAIQRVVPIYSNRRVAYHNVCSVKPKVSQISNRQETTYEAKFGAVTIIGLADTGAMVNVVTSETLTKIPKGYKRNKTSDKIPQSTADGTTITAMGTIELKIEAGKEGRWTKFYIWNSCEYELILGVPFFKTSGSTTFDWDNDLIYGNGYMFDMLGSERAAKVSAISQRLTTTKLYLKERVRLESKRGYFIIKEERIEDMPKYVDEVIFTPSERLGKLLNKSRAKVVVQYFDKLMKFKVIIALHPNEDDIVLKKGFMIGRLESKAADEEVVPLLGVRKTETKQAKAVASINTDSEENEVEESSKPLIDFNDMDDPTPITEADHVPVEQWRQEVDEFEWREVKTHPKFKEYTEERFKQVWDELKLSENKIFSKLDNRLKKKYRNLVKKFLHVWADTLQPLPGYEHAIKTGDAEPFRQRQYRLGQPEQQAIKEWVSKMTKEGLIERSNSPWASPMLCVKKPDGTFRVCMDARQLNKVTVRDAYPTHNGQESLEALGGASLFSVGDCYSGFWQIKLRPEDKEKTAVLTPLGLYHHLIMPMGLCNAPATFTKVMDELLYGIKDMFVRVYMDDFVLASKRTDCKNGESIEDLHYKQLKALLIRFSKGGMSLKAKKTNLLKTRIKFLGNIVTEKGLSPDPDKAKKISDAKAPTSVKELKSWLGKIGYYREYVENFSKLCAPLRKLDKKNMKKEEFRKQWLKPQEQAFKELKRKLMSEPIMAHPDVTKPFYIHCDGSYHGLGATLNQKGSDGKLHVIWYASRALSPAEKNYDARELECLALLWALEKWRHFLGDKLYVVTDHANLLRLNQYVKHKRRMIRWACRISEYNIILSHRAGAKHTDADHMSRIPEGTAKSSVTAAITQMTNSHIGVKHNHIRRVNKNKLIINIYSEEVNLDEVHHNSQESRTPITYCLPKPTKWEKAETNLKSLEVKVTAIKSEEAKSGKGKKVSKVQTTVTYRIPRKFTVAKIKAAQNADSYTSKIIANIKAEKNNRWTRRFKINDKGLLVHTAVIRLEKGTKQDRLERKSPAIVVPASLQDDLISYYHHEIQIAHQSLEPTYERISKNFYWRGMRKDIKEFIDTCIHCKKGKTTAVHQSTLVPASLVNQQIWGTIHCDYTHVEADNNDGYRYILSIKDECSDFLVLEPVREQNTKTTIDVIYKRVICQIGELPYRLIMDGGMYNEEVAAFFKDLGINCRESNKRKKQKVEVRSTTAYNPKANPVERMHRELKKYLRAMVHQTGHQAYWPEFVAPFTYRWNSRERKKLGGYSPFQLIKYSEPALDIERVLSPYSNNYMPRHDILYHSKRIQEMYDRRQQARNAQLEKVRKFQEQQDEKDNNVRQPWEYEKGDFVIKKEKYIGSKYKGTSTSLSMKWSGPHKVLKKTGNRSNLYEIQLASGRRAVVPEELLRPLHPQTIFRKNEMKRFDFVNPEYVVYSPGDVIAYRPFAFNAEDEQDPSKTFRIGEIKSITYEGNEDKDLSERYLVQVYGVHKDKHPGTKQTLKSRLDDKHLPAYLPEEATAEEKKAKFSNMALTQDVTNDPEFQLEIEKGTFLPLPPTLLTKDGYIRAVSKNMIREYFKDFKATERANVEAQRGKKKKKSLKGKGVDGGSMKSILGKRNKAFKRHGEDFVYTIDIRERSLIQEYGSKTESNKRKSSSSANMKKKSKVKKKKKNTRKRSSEDTEEVKKQVKEMISGISEFVRNW
jgi:hypothetical protein